jgi:hypothetical protein
VLTSSRTGKLTLWDLSGLNVSPAAAAAAAPTGGAGVSKDSWLAPERPESSAVDCIRFLTGAVVAAGVARAASTVRVPTYIAGVLSHLGHLPNNSQV